MLAEGARGSEEVMQIFDLRKDCDPQQFGFGVKEVWEIPEGEVPAGSGAAHDRLAPDV